MPGGAGDAGFTPQRKLAESVLASNYGGTPTVFRGVPSQTLFSWETGNEGWAPSGFSTFPVTVNQSSNGATAGQHSLAVSQTVPSNGVNHFSWDAKLSLSGDALAAVSGALKDGAADYRIDLDITFDPAFIPQSGVIVARHLHRLQQRQRREWLEPGGRALPNQRPHKPNGSRFRAARKLDRLVTQLAVVRNHFRTQWELGGHRHRVPRQLPTGKSDGAADRRLQR